MKKYAHVNEVVSRLTEDGALRTFFTLYLMAESASERLRLNEQFQAAMSSLPLLEQQLMKAELTRCFLKLPAMAAELAGRAFQPA